MITITSKFGSTLEVIATGRKTMIYPDGKVEFLVEDSTLFSKGEKIISKIINIQKIDDKEFILTTDGFIHPVSSAENKYSFCDLRKVEQGVPESSNV